MAKTKKTKPTKAISLSLKIGTEVYTSEGDTSLEALTNLPHPAKLMNKGILTVRMGDKKKEVMYMPVQLKRLFYPQAQPFQAKYLATGLK